MSEGGPPIVGSAIVLIHVVKIDLQMTGVGTEQKLNPGGFVVINADNDNGSPVTNGIPARRDFNVAPLPNGVNDPDLVQVNVAVTPAEHLPGYFVLSAANYGTGKISL